MPKRATVYASAVVMAGAVTLAVALAQGLALPTGVYWIYLALSLIASVVKLRLPGMPGTYSLGFFFTLFGLSHFTLAETLLAGCLAVLAQSFINASKRPTPLQIAFNMANVCVSAGLSFGLEQFLLKAGWVVYGPALFVLTAACYFAMNTGFVSGILSILQGQPLASVSEEWYVWSFPYYLVGAALLGLIPTAEQGFRPEAALVLLPLLFLVHFYYSLTRMKTDETE